MEDVIDAVRGEFSDIGIADSPAAFAKRIDQSVGELCVAVRNGGFVKITADDKWVGALGGVLFYGMHLFGTFFISGFESAENTYTIFEYGFYICGFCIFDFIHKLVIVVAKSDGSYVCIVNAYRVAVYIYIGKDAGIGVFSFKDYSAGIYNRILAEGRYAVFLIHSHRVSIMLVNIRRM